MQFRRRRHPRPRPRHLRQPCQLLCLRALAVSGLRLHACPQGKRLRLHSLLRQQQCRRRRRSRLCRQRGRALWHRCRHHRRQLRLWMMNGRHCCRRLGILLRGDEWGDESSGGGGMVLRTRLTDSSLAGFACVPRGESHSRALTRLLPTAQRVRASAVLRKSETQFAEQGAMWLCARSGCVPYSERACVNRETSYSDAPRGPSTHLIASGAPRETTSCLALKKLTLEKP